MQMQAHADFFSFWQEFTLPEDFIEPYKTREVPWGFGDLSYITYKRSYARPLDLANPHGPTEEWWQTCRRVIEGTISTYLTHAANGATAVPEGPYKLAEQMYDRMFNMKWLPPGRGLFAMGTSAMRAKGAGCLNNCFASDTEIITAEGIKAIGPLAGTTQTLLTRNGAWVSAPIRSFGRQRLYKVVVMRQGVEKVIHTTADHRWFARDRRNTRRNAGYAEFKTTDLRPDVHHLQYVFGQGVKNNVTPSPFGIAHGFTYGDGRTTPGDRNANRVVLIGNKDANLHKFFSMCPESSRADGTEFGCIPNAFRELPSIKENKSYLYGWLAGYFAADGSVGHGQVTLSSARIENINFVRDVCAVLGIGTYAVREDTRVSNLTEREHTMFHITLMRDTLPEEFFLIPEHRTNFLDNGGGEIQRRHWVVKSVEATDRYEDVFCATVPETACFALADNILTGNCMFVSTKESIPEAMRRLMDFSMLGVGVGFDTRGEGLLCLAPHVDGSLSPYIVEDTREGWCDIVHYILKTVCHGGSLAPGYKFGKIRPRGTPLRTFGGTASGPEPLIELVTWLLKTFGCKVERRGLNLLVTPRPTGNAWTPWTEELILDVGAQIGHCVVMGGIRRTALICLGKNGGPIATAKNDIGDKIWRYRSNNSIIVREGDDYTTLAKETQKFGEPGYFWLDLARSHGRLADAANFLDNDADGTNPCVEQTLFDNELCCLVETFPARCTDEIDFAQTLACAYFYAKAVTLLPTHDPVVNEVIEKNRRMGVSLAGVVQALKKHGPTEFWGWLDRGYKTLRKLDEETSEMLGVATSRKLTSVKPGGTVPLLAGATPGMHWDHAPYYIRRERFSSDSPYLKWLEGAGYQLEACADDPSSVAVNFLVKSTEHAHKPDIAAREQLTLAALLQKWWADNQVSVTVHFRPDEDLLTLLKEFEGKLKGVSFIPYFDDTAGDMPYSQLPYETIDETTYENLISKVSPVWRRGLTTAGHETTDAYCDNDTCKMRV